MSTVIKQCRTVHSYDEVVQLFIVAVPDGVGLYLDGNQLANYSIVNLEDIGEGECALICYTNSPDCCASQKAGEWYFPNGSAVSIEGDKEDFYRNRNGMMVHLH